MFDLGPAAQQLSRVVTGVDDDRLGDPTPCAEWSVADLLAHVHQLATVFTQNARKVEVVPPDGLADDWRAAIPAQLDELASAWRDEPAWRGRVSAGGVDMDAADNAVVAIEELAVHGWDLARATGQPYDVPDDRLDRIDEFFTLFVPPGSEGNGPYGAPVPAPDGADRLARTLAHTGRDPGWTAGRGSSAG